MAATDPESDRLRFQDGSPPMSIMVIALASDGAKDDDGPTYDEGAVYDCVGYIALCGALSCCHEEVGGGPTVSWEDGIVGGAVMVAGEA